MKPAPGSRLSYFRRKRAVNGCRYVTFLWSDVYRGVQVGDKWVGWTNPEWKKRGW